ncbi:MAG: hypothetical protein QOF76_2559, partial [Solirubrobacteraceae bacterium]|nr:hypothetical protein [Solirubrobacteraceae bacterium]
LGREPGTGQDPQPPLEDRHGIPNSGACLRCNLQMEGSGVSADDVVVDAGEVGSGDKGPRKSVKDVGIRVDRADGFVLRNLKVRHAREHDIYVLEADGYRLDRFKTYWGGEYGVLTFVEDHGVMRNCEAAGSGDSGLYPGAGAKTSAGRDTKYYPAFRYSQEIRLCDSHHNDGGYSGTDGNATHIDHNNFYDNALGFTTDVFTAPGHPGFPQQGDLIEDNNFYSNNFNPYVAGSDVKPSIAAPVGTGLWIAGGNDNIVRNNRFWDNRRRGVMLFAVPDSTVCGPGIGSPVTGCDSSKMSTSYNNSFYGNVMGVAPDGSRQPNGTVFWWDSFAGNTGNCWYANTAAPGHSVTSSPSPLPDCAGGTDPSASTGTGDVQNESELTSCLAGFEVSGYPNGNQTICTWTQTPAKPTRSQSDRQLDAFVDFCRRLGANPTCTPFAAELSARGVVLDTHAPSLGSDLGSAWPQPASLSSRPLGLFTCADWKRRSSALRGNVLGRLRRWVGGAVEGSALIGYGAVLPDDVATVLFDARCSQPHSASFALYKIYGSAAGFAGVAP